MSFLKSKQNLIFVILAILLPVIYGLVFIRNFTFPLTGGGDTDEWEFVGYYLAENIRFDVFPQLILRQNQSLYPFGVSQVFSDWSLESNYWFAFLFKTWGHGGWLNYYYVLSLIISFLGSYLLLKKDFGQQKALFAGFVVTFFNFYALNKYPGHFTHSTIHWTILSIFSDFVLVKRIILREEVSVKWVFLKAFLLIATLGLNLSYICGFSLSCFVLSLIVTAFVLVKRQKNKEHQLLNYLTGWIRELKNNRKIYLLALPSIILLYFYLPIIAQIYLELKAIHSTEMPHLAGWWSNPFRMLIPYLPFFSAIDNPLIGLLKDFPEGVGSGSPGWFCLGIGSIGLLYNRKKHIALFLPLFILLVLYTFYHPVKIPILKVFPWGSFNRVPSRFTSMIPVIFLCFFLPVNFSVLKYRKIIKGFLILIGLTEGITVYSTLWHRKPFLPDSNFFNYMSVIGKQKGEAVLDFPFCIIGGDGTGYNEGLCPVYDKTCNLYTFTRFHHKKTVGGYYSYILPETLKGFVNVGVSNLFLDGPHEGGVNLPLVKEFSEEQLNYFVKYFQYNDFAGISLCTDLVNEKLYQQIVDTVGKPIQTTILPGAGRAVFIPKPEKWRAYVDLKKAVEMKYPCGCQ